MEKQDTAGPTDRLASFASELRLDDVPVAVIAHAKLCLLDTLGCALFGSTLPWSVLVHKSIGSCDSGGPSAVWGTPLRWTTANAALANGAAIHGFELDDLHPRSIVHPGSVVIPAALALADSGAQVTGTRLLTALIAGYEVVARIGMAVGVAHLLQGWHPTGTHGTLGAAAAAGAILKLTPRQMADAFGIAGTQSAGLMASQYGSMVKRFHAGRAAQSGVYAALLASNGYTGIRNLFEAEYGGYLSTFSPTHDAARLVERLGDHWETAAVGFKLYSTNGSCHTTIDALLDIIRTERLRARDVANVTAFVSSATKKHVGWPYVPDSVTTAQMNLPYVVAVTLTDGDAFINQFTDSRIADESLVALSRRVQVIADPTIDRRGNGFRHAVRLEVTTRSGRVIMRSREHARGSPLEPLLEKEIRKKYRDLARRVPGASAERVEELVDSIENVRDSRELTDSLAVNLGA